MKKGIKLRKHAMLALYIGCGVLLIIGTICLNYRDSINYIKVGLSNESLEYQEQLAQNMNTVLKESGYYFDKVEVISYDNPQTILQDLINAKLDIAMVDSLTYVNNIDASLEVVGAKNSWVNFNGEEVYFKAYYNSILLTKNNRKARQLLNKAELSFEDLNSLSYCVQKPTSLIGYLYFNYYLEEKFNKHIYDLDEAFSYDNYAEAINALSADKCEVVVGYQNIREDYEEEYYLSDIEKTIYDETVVLLTLDNIYTNAILINKENTKLPEKKLIQLLLEELAVYADGSINNFTLLSDEAFKGLYKIVNNISPSR